MPIPRTWEREPRSEEATAAQTVPTKPQRVVEIEVAYPGEHVSETLWPERGDSYAFNVVLEPTHKATCLSIQRGTVRVTLKLGSAYWWSINEHTIDVPDVFTPSEAAIEPVH